MFYSLPPILVSFLTLVGVILVLKYGLNCLGMFLMKTRRHVETPWPSADVHSEVRRHVQPWLNRLGELGFSGPCVFRIDPLSGWERLMWRVTHAETKTIAEVRLMVPPTGGSPHMKLSFFTFLSDGRFLVTSEPDACDHVPPHWLLLGRRFGAIGDQWETHRGRLGQLETHITPAAPANLAQAIADEYAATDQASIDAGMLRQDPKDAEGLIFRRLFIPWYALKMMKFSLPGKRPKPRPRSDVMPLAPPEPGIAGGESTRPDDLIERDLAKYQQLAGSGKGLGKLAKLGLLVVTLGLFAWFWKDGNARTMTAVVVGILLLHEFGHWLPMKLFGYKNVTMFFVPGFGAAVSGEKQHAPAWQEFLVLMGGPLPGLLAGIAVFGYGYFNRGIPDIWLDAAALAIVINAFNLLPVLPLDGGRILDLLVFRDFPVMRLLFNAVSALCVFGASLLPGAGFMRYLAFFMAMRIFKDVKLLRVLKEARKLSWAGRMNDKDAALRKYFGEIRAAGNAEFVGSKDWFLKTQTIIHEVLRKRPGWLMRIAGIGSYASFCLIPLLFFTGVLAISMSGWFAKSFGVIDYIEEFRTEVSKQGMELTPEQIAPIDKLTAATGGLMEGSPDQPMDSLSARELAASFPPTACRDLDYLKWEDVGTAQRNRYLSPCFSAIWLESACRRMEKAAAEGRNKEAVRRTEILLHAIHSLEPAIDHSQREFLWDVQIRTLQTIASLNGKGAVPARTQDGLRRRILALGKTPDPASEAALLVDGWSQMEIKRLVESGKDRLAAPPVHKSDSGYFRSLYTKLDELRKSADQILPAPVAVAQWWKTDGKAEVLPDKLPGLTKLSAGDAEYLYAFCDRRQESAWMRASVLSAIQLDLYQKQNGRLPSRWQALLPGGGNIELIPGPAPVIRLSDKRDDAQRAGPAWLRKAPAPQRPIREFPLPAAPPKTATPASPAVNNASQTAAPGGD